MRAHTASGTLRTVALAPEPTAAGFFGNRIRGSAPARATGASPDAVGVMACGMDFQVLLALDAVEAMVEVKADVGRADVAVSVAVLIVVLIVPLIAAGEPAPQPARRRQTRLVTVVTDLAVLLRGMVRSIRLVPPGTTSVP